MAGTQDLELVIGWSNGRVEVRSVSSGEVIAKDSLDHAIAAIFRADFRLDGRMQVIVLSVQGELRGYLKNLGVVRTDESRAQEQEQELIALQQTKIELQCELKNYEDNMRHMKSGQMKQGEGQLIMIPTDTEVNCQWQVDVENKSVNLRVATNNKTIVRAVVIFADQLFPGESLFVGAKEQLSELIVPLAPDKDIQTELYLKVSVGRNNSSLFAICTVLVIGGHVSTRTHARAGTHTHTHARAHTHTVYTYRLLWDSATRHSSTIASSAFGCPVSACTFHSPPTRQR